MSKVRSFVAPLNAQVQSDVGPGEMEVIEHLPGGRKKYWSGPATEDSNGRLMPTDPTMRRVHEEWMRNLSDEDLEWHNSQFRNSGQPTWRRLPDGTIA